METTYTIEFMRLAEPTIAPIKQPSAFHVAYYCNLSLTLLDPSGKAQIADLLRKASRKRRLSLHRSNNRVAGLRSSPPGHAF
jgi:hypothetical protein